jgi:predicted pyridoxine 5'-phosphate oxidase superfamily flavin-nucleotide-binding protein
MRRDDNKKKILTSVEIVDVPPPAYNETEEDVSVSAGMTQLSKEELHHLFNNRNLAFVATLSKDGSPHVTPVWTEMVDDLVLILLKLQRKINT